MCWLQGQASDVLIQAKEIERLRDLLVQLYVKHTGQDAETVRKSAAADKTICVDCLPTGYAKQSANAIINCHGICFI